MPRRLGANVPVTVSRLLQAGFIRSPPAWFEAVSSIAPLRASLTRQMPAGSSNTSSIGGPASTSQLAEEHYRWKGSRRIRHSSQLKYRPPKPQPIRGYDLRDKIRKHFFEDHPFEAYRGINLVEQGQLELVIPGPKDAAWTELRQRSRKPSADDVVDFVHNLHTNHSIPLDVAYSNGVRQFRSLRASHETANHAAQVEAEAYGSTFPTEHSPLDRLERAQDSHLRSVLKDGSYYTTSSSQGSTVSSKQALNLLEPPQGGRTGGPAYIQGDEGGNGSDDSTESDLSAGGRKALPESRAFGSGHPLAGLSKYFENRGNGGKQ